MEAGPVHQAYIEKWFCFSIVWSLLAAADRPSRKRLDYLMRDIDSTFPAANTIYDYWVDPKVCFFFVVAIVVFVVNMNVIVIVFSNSNLFFFFK